MCGKGLFFLSILWMSVTGDEKICSTPRPPEAELLDCLFANYNPNARPVKRPEEVITVNLTVSLMKIVDLVEKEHLLLTKGWVQMTWTDKILVWDKRQYHIDRLWVDPKKIWKPDIMMYNYAEDMYDVMLETPALVQSNGDVMWAPNHALIKSYCPLDLTWFPYDTQVCKLEFGSWSYDMKQVNLVSGPNSTHVELPYYGYEGHEWRVGSVSRVTRHFTWGQYTYPVVRYAVELVRQPTYYRHVFVIPSFLVALLTTAMFLLPPSAGERMSLGAGLLITNAILLMMMENHMPTEMGDVPAVVVYLTYNLVMLSLALLLSMLVLNMHHRDDKRSKVPNWVRQVILLKLGRCLWVKSENYVSLHTDDNSLFTGDVSGDGGGGGGPAELRVESELIHNTPTPTNSTRALETTLDDIRKYLRLLASKTSMPEVANPSHRQTVLNEWHQVACVVDRLFCLTYLLVTLLITAVFYGHRD